MPTLNSFGTRTDIRVGGEAVEIYSLPALERAGFGGVSRLPYSLKILLENLLRREDNAFVKSDDIRALADWSATGKVEKEIGNHEIATWWRNSTSSPAANAYIARWITRTSRYATTTTTGPFRPPGAS